MGFNKIYVAVGDRSQGKTPLVLGGDYERGLYKTFLDKGMSTLIIDEFDHPKYRHVPTINPEQYHLLSSKPGIYRTLATLEKMPALFPLLKKVWNTLIVFEDAHKYFPMKLTKSQIAILGNSKNQNNDILFMYWSWGFIPPDIFRLANYYIIFWTRDSPEKRKNHLATMFKPAMEAYEKKQKHKLINGLPYIIISSGV